MLWPYYNLINKLQFFTRFKYRFSPQPLVFVSNWSLTFQLCQISPQPFNLVSKCWMENTDVANGLLLILKMYDMSCQDIKKKKKKFKSLTPLQNPLPPRNFR